jgi:hypothetical protein
LFLKIKPLASPAGAKPFLSENRLMAPQERRPATNAPVGRGFQPNRGCSKASKCPTGTRQLLLPSPRAAELLICAHSFPNCEEIYCAAGAVVI